MDPKTEIRHLRPADRRNLIEMLDSSDHWRQLAAILPKPDSDGGYLMTSKMIQLLESHKNQINGSPTRALLDYWGTYGRKRATIKDLVDNLVACKLYKAADYVSMKLLNGDPVIRGDKEEETIDMGNDEGNDLSPNDVIQFGNNSLESHPQSTSNEVNSLVQSPDVTSLSLDDNSLNCQVKLMLERDTGIKRYAYNQLAISTNNFNSSPINAGGYKLGEGAYGIVFLGRDNTSGKSIAIKCVRDEYGKEFIRELDVLTRLNHDNLLALLGIACEGTNLCLVYEYMVNGSLSDRLICLNGTEPIPWTIRKQIAIGSAQGIYHLHANSFIHRDIKSANILLDYNWNPKIGDFGLARFNFLSSTGSTSFSNNFTSTITGTSIYMSPESFRGQLTTKMDIYSFGIVLLELLTGLSPFDEKREGGDILTWSQSMIEIDSNNDLTIELVESILDPKAGQWDGTIALAIMRLSRESTEYDKRDRPSIETILNELNKL